MRQVRVLDRPAGIGNGRNDGHLFGVIQRLRRADCAEDIDLARKGGWEVDEIVRADIDVLRHVPLSQKALKVHRQQLTLAHNKTLAQICELVARSRSAGSAAGQRDCFQQRHRRGYGINTGILQATEQPYVFAVDATKREAQLRGRYETDELRFQELFRFG